MEDKPFITARADEALTTYCDAVEEGFSYPEAESMASEVLYRDLAFLQIRHACVRLGE